MWINKKKFYELEKKVAELEKSQLQSIEMVKKYVEDSETLSNILAKEIDKLPDTIMRILADNGIDK